VLPFTNMSGDAEQEYFSDGITEDLITDLSRLSGLFVIARHSTFTYKAKAVKVQEVSRELGVRYVLEGSVRKAGERVRITAQLVDENLAELKDKMMNMGLKPLLEVDRENFREAHYALGGVRFSIAEYPDPPPTRISAVLLG